MSLFCHHVLWCLRLVFSSVSFEYEISYVFSMAAILVNVWSSLSQLSWEFHLHQFSDISFRAAVGLLRYYLSFCHLLGRAFIWRFRQWHGERQGTGDALCIKPLSIWFLKSIHAVVTNTLTQGKQTITRREFIIIFHLCLLKISFEKIWSVSIFFDLRDLSIFEIWLGVRLTLLTKYLAYMTKFTTYSSWQDFYNKKW